MTALIALASSLVFGASDFMGGVASRRSSAFRVTTWGQISGLVVGVALALVVGANALTGDDVVASLVAGATTSFSVVCFYAALSRGAMSIIAPTTGVLGGAVPAVYGIVRGDETPPATAIGLIVAFAAIVLVTRVDDEGEATPRSAIALAAVAGVGFGLFFVALEQTGNGAGMWPIVIARFVSVPATALLAISASGGIALPPTTLRLAAWTGATEMVANALILTALRRGPLAVASVFGSLYPLGTALLAFVLLRERLGRSQLTGVALAMLALVLVAL